MFSPTVRSKANKQTTHKCFVKLQESKIFNKQNL